MYIIFYKTPSIQLSLLDVCLPFPKCLFFETDKNLEPFMDWNCCNLTPSLSLHGMPCGKVELYKIGYTDFRLPPKWLPYTNASLLIIWLPVREESIIRGIIILTRIVINESILKLSKLP